MVTNHFVLTTMNITLIDVAHNQAIAGRLGAAQIMKKLIKTHDNDIDIYKLCFIALYSITSSDCKHLSYIQTVSH